MYLPNLPFEFSQWELSNYKRSEPSFNRPWECDLNLGVDTLDRLFLNGKIALTDKLFTKENKFGWVLSGVLPDYQNNLLSNHTQFMSPNDLLERFGEIEEFKQDSLLTPEEQECEEHYEEKTQQRVLQGTLLSNFHSNMIQYRLANVFIKLRDNFCRLNDKWWQLMKFTNLKQKYITYPIIT